MASTSVPPGDRVKDIGERIREIRESQRMTQDELAAAAALSKSFISDVERGKRSISTANLLRISRALRTNIEYLATGSRPEGMLYPTELQIVALELNLTFAQARDLLNHHRNSVTAGGQRQQNFDVDYWKDLHAGFRDRWTLQDD